MEKSDNKPSTACWRFDNELRDFLEGEDRPFVVAHRRGCVSCGALFADLQAIRQAARNLPQEEPCRLEWQSVRVRLEAEGIVRAPACLRFEDDLEAYLEGDARPHVMAHARDCSRCGILLADVEAIRAAARDLPQEEPSRVVWANVRATLEAEGAFGNPVSGWRQLLAWRTLPHAIPLGVLAALVVIGSVLTLPSWNLQRWAGMETATGSVALNQETPALRPGNDSALAHVVSELESNFRANEASMSPDLKATYEQSLVSLNGSIEECLDSLQHEPRNALAHEYLVTAYTRKAEILSSALEFDGR
jgi:hypothetical protein